MSDVVIRVENLSKHYRLGTIGGATLREDMQRWWAQLRGKPDPLAPLDGQGRPDGTDHWALRDVSFEVKRGEVLGIIGRNGAGKSTLLKILSRTTAPTSGRAMVKGRIGSLLEVGTGFHPELTGRENIYLNGSILGMRKAEIDRKIDEIIDFSGVERFIDTPVKRYSSGMYVRLAFAVAAYLESQVLVIDEVLAVGDSEFQRRCLSKMEDLGNSGRTVLFVSHQMPAVLRLTTRAVLIEDGKSKLDGPPADVIQQYLAGMGGGVAKSDLSWGETSFSFDIRNTGSSGPHISRSDDEIRFVFSHLSGPALENIDFQIAILTRDDFRLLTLSSRIQSSGRMRLGSGSRIEVTWRNDSLLPGEYFVSLGLWSFGQFRYVWERLAAIRIEDRDVYQTAKVPEAYMGPIIARCNWSLIETCGDSSCRRTLQHASRSVD